MTTHTKTTKYTLNKKSERNCYHIKTFTYCTVNIKTSCKRSILICKIKQFKMVESTSNNTSASNNPAMFLLQQSKNECLVFLFLLFGYKYYDLEIESKFKYAIDPFL